MCDICVVIESTTVGDLVCLSTMIRKSKRVKNPVWISGLLLLRCSNFVFLVHGLNPITIKATTTTTPPLIDVPTFSMATTNEDGTTNMNILTYATPVSVRPDRVWTLGLYKDTLSYANFCRERSCILQLLKEEHIPLIKLLGGSSGTTVDKQEECSKEGFFWGVLSCSDEQQQISTPLTLANCAYYLKLAAVGDLVDCGSHAVAVCKVEEMYVSNEEAKTVYLSTARLRELGIITDQGRVAAD